MFSNTGQAGFSCVTLVSYIWTISDHIILVDSVLVSVPVVSGEQM